jgi:Big-like domain-containing protein
MRARLVIAVLLAVVGSIAAVNGCAAGGNLTDPSSVTPPDSGPPPGDTSSHRQPHVAAIVVSPTAVSGVPGDRKQVTATPKDSTGATVSGQTISWSSSNTAVATVSGSGLITLVHQGTATVTARTGGVSAALTVTVNAPPPPVVASVSVAPGAASLNPGQTVQLTATARDAGGNVLSGVAVTWASAAAGVASVSSTGLVTGVAAGSAPITATSGGKSGTATVTVQPASASAHECDTPQAAWLFCDDFESNRKAQYFEYDTAGGNFVRAPAVGVNGSTGMRVRYVAGGGSSFGSLKVAVGRTPSSYFHPVDAGTATYRELYWRVYVRNQPGWVGGGGDKLTRAISLVNANWAEAAFAHVWSGSKASTWNYLVLDPASGTDAAGNVVTTQYNDFANMRWLGAVQSATPIFDAAHVGQWYCVELHARLNDPGVSNGLFELSINGHLEAQASSLNWVGRYTTYGLNAVLVENFWNASAPVTEERYIDNFVVSTAPIGCPY